MIHAPGEVARFNGYNRFTMVSPTIAESVREYGRGVVGGLIFALPLLYTMEIWETGVAASPGRLLAGLAGTFGLLLFYNRFAGLREGTLFREVVVDSVEELALGLTVATLVLALTGRLSLGDDPSALVGKIAVCGMLSAIGVSVGTAQLGAENPQSDRKVKLGGQLAVGLCGAVLVGANVAPTEEISKIAYEAKPFMLVGLLVLSLLISAAIAGSGDFRGHRAFSEHILIPTSIFGAVLSVAIGAIASFALLAFFGQMEGNGLGVVVGQVVVLGLPATLGASAGRLLLQA